MFGEPAAFGSPLLFCWIAGVSTAMMPLTGFGVAGADGRGVPDCFMLILMDEVLASGGGRGGSAGAVSSRTNGTFGFVL